MGRPWAVDEDTVAARITSPDATVEQLKATPVTAVTGPVGGAQVVATSVTTDANPAKADDVSQELVVPSSLAPGYYQFISVRVSGSGKSGQLIVRSRGHPRSRAVAFGPTLGT